MSKTLKLRAILEDGLDSAIECIHELEIERIDMALLIRRLCRGLPEDHKLRRDAIAYLIRKRLAGSPLKRVEPMRNAEGDMCGTCDGTYEHEHAIDRCEQCGVTGLAENMGGPAQIHECGTS